MPSLCSPLQRATFEFTEGKREEGQGLVSGKTKSEVAVAENRVAEVAYERTHVVIPFKVRSIATPDPVVHQHISVRGSSVFVPTIGESSGHTPREEAESLLGPAKVKGIG